MASPSSSSSAPPSRSIRADFISGSLVFLIALPLCLAIALASGFPPVAGVVTAIVGGVVVNFLAGAQLTIKGPSVALIVIAMLAVTELGQGDPIAGYRYTLAVTVVAAVIQIILALLRIASVGAGKSSSVAHGMLAALGVIVVAQQAHTSLGVAPESERPLALLFEIPSSVVHADPEIAIVGLASLGILFGLPLLARRAPRLAKIPASIVALLVAVALGHGFGLDHGHYLRLADLGQLPGSLLDALAFPDFAKISSPTSIKYVAMFALVGSIESTLGVVAVDRLDPAGRSSNLDRDLLAVGLGNLVCAAIGGLPMISDPARSKANVEAGASSRLASGVHGLLLLGFVLLVPAALEHVPLAALAAVLVHAGWQLAFKAVGEPGNDQPAPFWVAVFAILVTDLLIGMAVALGLQIILHVARRGRRS